MAKNGPKGQKILSIALAISGTIHHMIVIYVTPVKMKISPGNIFIFSKFDFLGLLEGKRAKSGSK